MAFFNGTEIVGMGANVVNGYSEEELNEARQESYEQGMEQGEQTEYDRFWDSYQNYGNRNIYRYAFSHEGWNDETFKPKYDIRPIGSSQVNGYTFYKCEITDLKAILDERNVKLDYSKSLTHIYEFYNSTITRLPTIDFSSAAGNISSTMSDCSQLVEIEKIIIADNGSYFNNTFKNCTSLEKVTFEGVLAVNGLNLQWSPLNIESLRSIISCLKDYSTYTGSTVYKVTVGSANLAKLTTEDLENIQAKGWQFV